jgi:hypothetical protein
MRDITRIIVHCSDSDISAHDDISVIREWHVHERGFNDVGYHFFIKSNGDIQEGRPLELAGAHVHGHNTDSIGICLHGKYIFTPAQFKALRRLVLTLRFEYDIPEENVHGHREFSNYKTCPNFNVREKLSTNWTNNPKDEKRV